MPEDDVPSAWESYEFEDADEVRPLDYDPEANDPMSLEELRWVDEENRSEYFMDTTTCPNIDQELDGAVKIKFFGCNSLYITVLIPRFKPPIFGRIQRRPSCP